MTYQENQKLQLTSGVYLRLCNSRHNQLHFLNGFSFKYKSSSTNLQIQSEIQFYGQNYTTL